MYETKYVLFKMTTFGDTGITVRGSELLLDNGLDSDCGMRTGTGTGDAKHQT